MRSSIIALTLSACIFTTGSREIDRQATSLEVADEMVIDVLTRAGSLEVIGEAGRTTVELDVVVRAQLQAPWLTIDDQTIIDALVAELTPVGDAIEVDAYVDLDTGNVSTDVILRVPAEMRVEISDTSGDMRVSDVGALVIDDSSGDIDVLGIAGNIVVDDSSGDITLEAVQGTVDVRDNSGDVRVRSAGSVTVRDDSGDLVIESIDGDVTIDDDSGDILLQTVTGLATIRDGSGDIVAIDVAELDVVSDSSGSITRL